MVKITGISTCKGRLEHVKQTSKLFLESTPENVSYLLVDYACPEKTGQWVKDTFESTGRTDALLLTPSGNQFHKTIALNIGARYAINDGADYVLFFDADTLVHPGFIQKITPLLNQDKFIFVEPQEDTKDLTGLLILHQSLFRESGGFEESFRDWGAEDLEFRLRLYAKHKKQFDMISGEFLGSIAHKDEVRTTFYVEKDPIISNTRNIQRMRKMFAHYRHEDIFQWKKMEDSDKVMKLLGYLNENVPRPKVSR